ncbi:hypothetical protein ACH0BP_24815 [Bacillus nitratireducens]|nr:hypothetical protein [Bacillus nitratireducens]
MMISSVQEIGLDVYPDKKEEEGDTPESEEILNGLILYIGTGKASNCY